jgi:ABC-type branched-subunit amino acid transport system substrate-binding protein
MVVYVSRAAGRLGVGVAGTGHWGQTGPYGSLVRRIRAARADAVVLTGCVCTNGGELVTDLRDGLGASVPFLASDNFTCTCNMGGAGAPKQGYGMYISGAGAAPALLSASARRFLRKTFPKRPLSDLSGYAVTAAAATAALLQAISRCNGTRASVVDHLTHDRVTDTPIGSILFDANGDPAPAAFTISRVSPTAPPAPHLPTQGLVVDRVIEADPGLAAP